MRFVKFAFPYGDDIPRVVFEPLVVAQVALPATCAHSFFNGAPGATAHAAASVRNLCPCCVCATCIDGAAGG